MLKNIYVFCLLTLPCFGADLVSISADTLADDTINVSTGIDDTALDDSLSLSSGRDSTSNAPLPETEDNQSGSPSQDSSEIEPDSRKETMMKMGKGSGYSHAQNPFALGGSSKESGEVEEKSEFLFFDLARSLTVTSLQTKGDLLETEKGFDFAFSAGIKIKPKSFLRTGIEIEYMELNYTVKYKYSSSPDSIMSVDFTTSIQSEERLRYLALPLSLMISIPDLRFQPFIYCRIKPSFFLSGDYFSVERAKTVYRDETELSYERSRHVDISEDRESFLLFGGGGLGFEYHYGYGSLYIQGGVEASLLSPGNNNSFPVREESDLILFPVSAGVRFSL